MQSGPVRLRTDRPGVSLFPLLFLFIAAIIPQTGGKFQFRSVRILR